MAQPARKVGFEQRDVSIGPPRQRAAPADLASPLAFYAQGIDRSDYVAAVAPRVRSVIGEANGLLDIGAGGGQLGAALCGAFAQWVALEPDAQMRARLARRVTPKPVVVDAGWECVGGLNLASQDVTLAANIGATLTAPVALYNALKPLSRSAMVWIVPAQKGPRGMCLAACLEPAWHGEAMQPGHEITLAALGARAPQSIAFADWTFRCVFPSLAHAQAHFLRGLQWCADDPRLPALRARLEAQAVRLPDGVMLSAHKTSAILIWTCAS
jgi:hypothetical protein